MVFAFTLVGKTELQGEIPWVWDDDNRPVVYPTSNEAEEAYQEFLAGVEAGEASGYMEPGSVQDYETTVRVVPITLLEDGGYGYNGKDQSLKQLQELAGRV